MSTLAANPDAAFAHGFAKGELEHRIRQTRLCIALAMMLIPAFGGLDALIYPQYLHAFLLSRALQVAVLMPCFVLLFSPGVKQLVRPISHMPLAVAAVGICWMIYHSEGALSPYYAGLNLVVEAAILLVPYTVWESVLICTFVLASYLIACLMHAGQGRIDVHSVRPLLVNLYFLAAPACVAVFASHYTYIHRLKEFRLRHELDTNNQQLGSTLRKLQTTEVQLVQSEKMNALGKLSAGLLHEVNNPLNYSFLALQVARKQVKNDPDALETLNDINEGMSRIRTVISDLRAFAHPTEATTTETFTLDDVLTIAIRLTAHELGTVEVDRTEARGSARGAKTQFVHVLMNLLVNSAYALRKKQGGTHPRITISAAPISNRLKVTVRDNGTGVDPDHLKKLFDPFFTTKPPGEGTGLGLSICHTIVANHGGELTVRSQLGEWTAFDFDLPLSESDAI